MICENVHRGRICHLQVQSMLHALHCVSRVTVVFASTLVIVDRHNIHISAIVFRVFIDRGLFNTIFARGWLLHSAHPCCGPVRLRKRIDRLFQVNDELIEWTLPGSGLLNDLNVRHCIFASRTCTLELSALSCSIRIAR